MGAEVTEGSEVAGGGGCVARVNGVAALTCGVGRAVTIGFAAGATAGAAGVGWYMLYSENMSEEEGAASREPESSFALAGGSVLLLANVVRGSVGLEEGASDWRASGFNTVGCDADTGAATGEGPLGGAAAVVVGAGAAEVVVVLGGTGGTWLGGGESKSKRTIGSSVAPAGRALAAARTSGVNNSS
jgi:hypothetical protein